jgi:hypothetical protein
MAVSYRCAYCGSQQTWDGSGSRVCTQCGATQPADDTSGAAASASSKKRWPWIVLTCVLLAGVVTFLVRRSAPTVSTADHPATPLHSRIVVINNPEIRTVPADSHLSALDLLRSAPSNTGTLFDTKLLSISTPHPMKDTEGALYYVGEVVNHSRDTTAIAPTAEMALVKNGRTVETSDLNFSDLPPGGHSPAYFSWDGSTSDFDHIVFRWKPVQGYPTASASHPRLETTITGRKMTPGSVTVNFTYTYHYVSADVQGTVTNRGDGTAKGIQLYLTLRDAKGDVTGFKEKDLNQLAPGQSVNFDLDADQWGNPVTSLDVEALAVTEPLLK